MHIALIGDSIFDNEAYTEGGPDVVTHLRGMLSPSERATLLAVDGAVMADVPRQLERLRDLLDAAEDARAPTHLALSVGGNDLLGLLDDLLGGPAGSVPEALLHVASLADRFGEQYERTLDAVLELGLPTVICTVYEGWFDDPIERTVTRTALKVFDDAILQAGWDRALPVVDLRRVCTEAEDYWNPIEPSDAGGRKIAAAVLDAFRSRPTTSRGGPRRGA